MNSQESLYDQLLELQELANNRGLYDAADFLSNAIAGIDRNIEPKARAKGRKGFYIRVEGETIEECIGAHGEPIATEMDAIACVPNNVDLGEDWTVIDHYGNTVAKGTREV